MQLEIIPRNKIINIMFQYHSLQAKLYFIVKKKKEKKEF